MTPVVCLSSTPWQSVPTRTQHLMSRLKNAEVLFFEPPAGQGSDAHKKPGRKVRPNMTAYTLPPLWNVTPARRFLFLRNQRKIADFITAILRQRKLRDPLLWCTNPENVHILDLLAYKGLVYDCDRYWAGYPEDWESALAMNADVVFAASAGLVDRLSPCSDNIALMPNGCNFPMFTRPGLETPAGLKGVGRPLLGYAGTLWADLDYTPIFKCAAAHPDWTFLLVGPQQESEGLRRLREMDRVILTGHRPFIEMPDFVQSCDLCLDLRRTDFFGSDVVSTRVYEALAAGKPVVRHTFPGQVDEFAAGVVWSAADPQDFLVACEDALRENTPWLRARRQELAREAAWDKRTGEIEDILTGNAIY